MNTIEEKVEELEKKVIAFEGVTKALLIFGLIFSYLMNLKTVLSIPKFSKIFAEMLDGEYLPASTSIFMNNGRMFLAFDTVILIVLLIWLLRTKQPYAYISCCICIFGLLLQEALSVIAMFMPLLRLVEKLGG